MLYKGCLSVVACAALTAVFTVGYELKTHFQGILQALVPQQNE
jgi:hypothetical protein